MLNEHFEKLIKVELGNKTMLDMKRNKAYPEAKYGHDLPSLETLPLKLTHSISHSTSKERVLAT
jgi:hypothetical protein